MRYIAKVWVMDILDQVVVSGYVFDADDITDPDHTPHEFTYTTQGKGLDDPVGWLQWHLYEALQNERTGPRGGQSGPPRMDAPHTLSGTGDTGQNGVGLTVAGGPGGG